jgi:hypothetical protein
MPYFLASCGIKRFTGQGVEKTNNIIRRLYHLKNNKFDACNDGLQAVKWLDDLQHFECQPRNYVQHDREYWTEGIMEDRRKRPRLKADFQSLHEAPRGSLRELADVLRVFCRSQEIVQNFELFFTRCERSQ